MTNSIGQTANTGAVAAAASTATTGAGGSATPAVSQQQFMQLLIAQLKHQDPTQPLQGTEFVTQLAQFSLVEQSANQTQQLTSLNAQIAGLTNDRPLSWSARTSPSTVHRCRSTERSRRRRMHSSPPRRRRSSRRSPTPAETRYAPSTSARTPRAE